MSEKYLASITYFTLLSNCFVSQVKSTILSWSRPYLNFKLKQNKTRQKNQLFFFREIGSVNSTPLFGET